MRWLFVVKVVPMVHPSLKVLYSPPGFAFYKDWMRIGCIFFVLWSVSEVGLAAAHARAWVFYIERALLTTMLVFCLQFSLFSKVPYILDPGFLNPKKHFTFKMRLFLLSGPLGTWGSLVFFLIGTQTLITFLWQQPTLCAHHFFAAFLGLHILSFFLAIPRLCTFFPIHFYLNHHRPMKSAYLFSSNWRFFLLMVLLLPVLWMGIKLFAVVPLTPSILPLQPLGFVVYLCTLFATYTSYTALTGLALIQEEEKKTREAGVPLSASPTLFLEHTSENQSDTTPVMS